MSLFRKQTPDELWKLHREDFLKILSAERKPLHLTSLSYAFVDSNGKKYFRFPKDVTLPGERFGKLNEYVTFISKGLTAEEDILLDESIERLLEAGIGKSQKNVSAIGAILQERKKRRSLVIHTELLYNLMAVQLIREDESTESFDNDIQMQKVMMFKQMTKEGSTYFFFQKQELNRLSNLSGMSQSEWDQYWEESLIQQKALPQALKLFESSTI